jgi:hypothetical protein
MAGTIYLKIISAKGLPEHTRGPSKNGQKLFVSLFLPDGVKEKGLRLENLSGIYFSGEIH